MVRRLVTIALVLGACVAAVVLTGASSDESQDKVYKAEFDNAFGLTEGGDLRIGGVTAGQTTSFSLSDSEPIKAVVEFTITEPGFDSLREDAHCEIRQQSLIGEYYVDCQPGTSEEELPVGGTIPVEQTASTIPADLVNNILREPYRERLRLIIAELGTGLAGRPEDLAETIQRAHPGLRETNEVLEILAGQTQVLRNFVSDSDEVIDDLAANREDVARFVREAGETAAISATRREELAEQFRRLPEFLAELDPTMVRLGQLADAQVPLLADLRAASSDLERFFAELGPFAQASRPAIRTLGDTSVTGSAAIRESRDEIDELRQVAAGAGRVGDPLRQLLQTADDRERGYETDLRLPLQDPPGFDRESLKNRQNRNLEARGYTAMESLINYIGFWQSHSINAYDGLSHVLRALLIIDEQDPACTPINLDPTREEIAQCAAYTGPKQPGVNNATGVIGGRDYGPYDVDPTEGDQGRGSAKAAKRQSGASARSSASAAKGGPSSPIGGLPPEVEGMLDDLREQARPDRATEGLPKLDRGIRERRPRAPEAPAVPDLPLDGGASKPDTVPDSSGGLLEFLLGP